tara:strand:- start:140 stop:532 length:393 start_codon:yes stop_codon:yes gene_type:complete
MKPITTDFYEKSRKIKIYNKLIKVKKDQIINDQETKNAIIHGLLDSSSDDIFYEIADVLSLITDSNKEAMILLQTFIKEYVKYNIYDKLNKDFKISIDTKNVAVIIFRNIIIPTLIHDLFQSLIHYINGN